MPEIGIKHRHTWSIEFINIGNNYNKKNSYNDLASRFAFGYYGHSDSSHFKSFYPTGFNYL